MTGSCSSSSPFASGAGAPECGAVSARSTNATSSRKSNGFGRYSNAPRSVALTAVSSVFCALMTMMRNSGRIFLIRGIRSRPFSSGMITSVITRSPSPSATQRHRVVALPVIRTSWPSRARAWFSTVRIARSSSATSIVALIANTVLSTIPRRHGQEHAKNGLPRLAVELDDPAVVANHLRHQCKTKASSVALGRDERIEEVRLQFLGDAGAVIGDRHHQRNLQRTAATDRGEAPAMTIGRRDDDLPTGIGRRLGGILDEIEEYLDQQVAIAMYGRQRRVVFLAKPDMPRKARLRDPPHPFQHLVDIDCGARDRLVV